MRDGTPQLGRPSRRRPGVGRAHGPRPAGAGGLVAPAPRARPGRVGAVLGALGAAAPTAAERAGDGQDATQPLSDAPVLRLAGYEGPLDALLDQARAGRVDLQHLSLLALIEQCVAALDVALRALHGAAAGARDGTADGTTPMPVPVTLQRLAEWVGMAAWLALLRTRLLLPEDDPEARAARDEAEAFRRGLARRTAVREAADWLDSVPQLGRDVFARGAAPGWAQEEAERAAGERAALLRAYTRRIDLVPGQGRAAHAYTPRAPRLWRVPDALARMVRLLGTPTDSDAAAGVELWSFLPGPAALETAGLARDTVPDPALLDRSAVAGTFVAALELARQGRLTLAQEESFEAIIMHAQSEVVPEGQGTGAGPNGIGS